MSVSPRFLALNAFAFAFHHAINLAESSGEDRRTLSDNWYSFLVSFSDAESYFSFLYIVHMLGVEHC